MFYHKSHRYILSLHVSLQYHVQLYYKPIQKVLELQKQLAEFDGSEDLETVYGRLLGQVKDLYIQSFFEELIWRLDAEIETRKSTVPGTDITVSEFTFKNNEFGY